MRGSVFSRAGPVAPAETRKPLHTGGCQCGAIRFALFTTPFTPHLCHCRMCQKASGMFATSFAVINHSNFGWVRGAAKVFKSSVLVERGFCSHCGTSLSFQRLDRPWINIAIGAFDDPSGVAPQIHVGIESRVPWWKSLGQLPETVTSPPASREEAAALASLQHPDRSR